MKKIVVLIFLISYSFANAQNATIARADKYFDKTFYSKAIPLYLEVLPKNKSPHLLKRLADAYYYNSKMPEAARYYKMLLDIHQDEVGEDYFFKYSQSLMAQGKEEEAKNWMLKYAQKRDKVSIYQEELAVLNEVKKLGNRFEMENLAINTPDSDFGAFPFGNSIVYATPRKKPGLFSKNYKWNGQAYLDLYVIEASENIVADSISSGFSEAINSKLHESNAIFTQDGFTVYFTRNSETEDEDNISHLQIWKANFIDGVWTNAAPLPFNSDEYSIEHPALSPDEKYLFFSSDMPGSFGSFDIYGVEIKKDGSYGEPKNVGPKVNTDKREQFPFISSSNMLYFSSDGHTGMGLLDVFVSALKDGIYQNPVNVGLPVNSGYDDFSFYLDEATQIGYVASNRPGGKGDDDIYRIREVKELSIIAPIQFVEGEIKESDTGKPIGNVSMTVSDLDNNVINQLTASPEGDYRFKLEGNNTYKIKLEKPNYLNTEATLTLDDKRNKKVTKDFIMQSFDQVDDDLVKIEDQLLIKVENIYFDFDKWDIRQDAKPILDGVVAKMNQYPKMNIEVGSHTDQRGSEEYNVYLSEKRAKSTMNYMVSKGIDASRITYKGYGKAKTIVNCEEGNIQCSPKQHQLNRRSEFVILNID
ncbi:OmpA family protein [Ascidiimonas sp. W6]|uniref:OmpA family protein n=1 Tax=Ascidiimonas meishanensis TaxID=3128903 RepID=UPI0030ECDDB8